MQTTAGTPPAADAREELTSLLIRARELELRKAFAEGHEKQVAEQWSNASNASPAEAKAFERQLLDARLERVTATVDLDATRQKIRELEAAQNARRAEVIVQPPRDPFLGPGEIMTVLSGGFLLLFPFVLVFARRLWLRSGRRLTLDPESSPRLQRIEQAVEAIALEVERIGEAQRFTTKLLAERKPDPIAPMPARKEPGVITPH